MKEDEVKEPEAVASSEDAKSIEETSSPEGILFPQSNKNRVPKCFAL